MIGQAGRGHGDRRVLDRKARAVPGVPIAPDANETTIDWNAFLDGHRASL